jgi:hypothetical protein
MLDRAHYKRDLRFNVAPAEEMYMLSATLKVCPPNSWTSLASWKKVVVMVGASGRAMKAGLLVPKVITYTVDRLVYAIYL